MVMELPADPLQSEEAESGEQPPELPFLNMARFLEARGLRVPRIYLEAVADRAVLLEDLGDLVFSAKVERVDSVEMARWYGAAVGLLARMHDAMWPLPSGCVAATRSFDYELVRWELDHYREWGIEALAASPLAPTVRTRLDRAFDCLAREVAELPAGFVHRDYQSRNLMVLEDTPRPEHLAIIDFQDGLVGPRIYDLVALLNDSYVDLPWALKADMITRYARQRGMDPERLTREFHLVTVQRKLKDGGRFVFIDKVKGNPSFLSFVDGSFARVRQSLEALDGHEALQAALAESDPRHFGQKNGTAR